MIPDKGIFWPNYCARCHYPWIGKAFKEICPKCEQDDMVCSVRKTDFCPLCGHDISHLPKWDEQVEDAEV